MFYDFVLSFTECDFFIKVNLISFTGELISDIIYFWDTVQGGVTMKVKKWDVIIIGILVLASFIPALIFTLNTRSATDGYYVEIKVQGEFYERVQLTGHTGRDEVRIETDLGVNIVEIVDEKVGMYEADCPDKVCYSPEYISRPGETIVCLPNRIVIEVKGEEPQEDDEDIITGFKSDNHD